MGKASSTACSLTNLLRESLPGVKEKQFFGSHSFVSTSKADENNCNICDSAANEVLGLMMEHAAISFRARGSSKLNSGDKRKLIRFFRVSSEFFRRE